MQYGARSLPPTGVSRMLASPASSTAAAAEAPEGTRMLRPSTSTRMDAAGASGRGRNIEALGREWRHHRIERTRCDHRRKGVGMRRRQGHAAVAIGGEGAGKLLGFVVDRQT